MRAAAATAPARDRPRRAVIQLILHVATVLFRPNQLDAESTPELRKHRCACREMG
jgi:hypothetical protein